MANGLKQKLIHWILGITFVLIFAATCYAASPLDGNLSPDTKDWLKILITIGTVPLLVGYYKQGNNKIIDEIKDFKETFKSHWHDIDCDNPDCDKPKTTGLYINIEK
jgi:hypothetical protein